MTQRLPFIALLLLTLCGAACSATGSPRVAILNFENATGNEHLDCLEAALPEYLIATLSNGHDTVMLERQIPKVFTGKPPVKDPAQAREWLAQNARRATFLVAGSVSRLDRNFILTARLCDAKKGEVLPGTSCTEACILESDIYPRMQVIAKKIAEQLKTRGVETPLSRTSGAKTTAAEPSPTTDSPGNPPAAFPPEAPAP